MPQDIRWKQRFANYEKALNLLKEAVETYNADSLEIIKEGTIQRFEFTHELAWHVMKDYLVEEGHQNITGSKSATRQAFSVNLIENGQVWMDMIESRNTTVHAYDLTILEEEYNKIVNLYFPLLMDFYSKMKTFL